MVGRDEEEGGGGGGVKGEKRYIGASTKLKIGVVA